MDARYSFVWMLILTSFPLVVLLGMVPRSAWWLIVGACLLAWGVGILPYLKVSRERAHDDVIHRRSTR